MLWKNKKRKFLAIFVLRERETYHVIGKRKIKSTTKLVRYRGGKYPVDVSYPTYTKKNKNLYFLDVKIINQILMDDEQIVPTDFEFKPTTLDGSDSKFELMNPQTLSDLIRDKNLRAMFSSITNATKFHIMELFIGVIAGVGIGWLIRDIITGGYF